MVVDNTRARLMAPHRHPERVRPAARWSPAGRSAVLVAWRRVARRALGIEEAAGRHAGAGQVPLGARHRGTEQEALADRARVLPATDGQLSAEPVSRRRQARTRRQLPRRGLVGIAGARDQRISRVPLVLPDAPARAYYAQYKLGMCHYYQMHGPDRDQTETREAIAELRTMVRAVSEQPAAAGSGASSCARRAID